MEDYISGMLSVSPKLNSQLDLNVFKARMSSGPLLSIAQVTAPFHALYELTSLRNAYSSGSEQVER